MEIINIFYYLAVILIFAKVFGLIARKIGLPQVAGMVVAGVLIGLMGYLNDPDNFFLSFFMKPNAEEMDILHVFAQIGVVLILFSSGLETNLQELKKSGGSAFLIALAGVIVPMFLGTVGTLLFMNGYSDFNSDKFLNAIFVGTILAATSVGITAETLKELGKLNGKVGQTIMSAAIIDDVIGIIALSIVTSLRSGGAAQIGMTLLKSLGFFVFAIGIGILLRIYFKWEEHKFPHKRRTSIFAFGMCFLFAFVAEKFFGIASITGAYLAGIMLSGLDDTNFVDRKVIVSGYMIFTPIFFSYIGISADFSGFNISYLLFALTFVALGIIGKIIGCGLTAKPFGFTNKESVTVGCGMIARGEVALAVYSAGRSLIMPEGGIDPLVATIFLIVISSIVCPILLKLLFKDKKEGLPLEEKQQ
ncbi:MAG: cation:proton antiporter [Clostridia bacterium]|nr:cation:proton antiporter [Clostridia bacterium]